MDIQKYIDSLFVEYEETAALTDFKEELQSNLEARVKSLISKGTGEEEAFYKASQELQNITLLADEICLKKKQQVIEDMYMGIRRYMNPTRIIFYIICGLVLAFGIIRTFAASYYMDFDMVSLYMLLPFCTFAAGGFTYLGLTQETAGREPMYWARAAYYAAAAAVFTFGIIQFTASWINNGLPNAVGTLIPFVLPSAAVGVFLILTEKDHKKAWKRAQLEAAAEEATKRFRDPAYAKQYGLLCGAIWILAVSIFILLTMTIGIAFSWITFLFAAAIQLLLEFAVSRKESK